MSALSDVVRGDEWIVEAFGCDAGRLADRATLAALLDRMVNELALRPIGAKNQFQDECLSPRRRLSRLWRPTP